ncbi:MAG: hypothetical protein OEW21_00045 [Betaproteobacteria bacterium]|nr:hypothetical protein [Betaproteobacteria bacterium]
MKIGDEEFNIPAESKRALDVEVTLMTAMTYVVIFAYALDYLSWPVFYLLFHLLYMRFFMGAHDRMHTDQLRRWPRAIELMAEHFAVVAVPWAEPIDSIRKKHFTHHLEHMPGKVPGGDMLKDPHSIYESGGFWRSLFYCTFFEEAQLVIDIRNRNITTSRWIRLAIYLPLLVLFVLSFGWEKYLGVVLAVRLMSAIAWLSFSWFSHTQTYRFGLDKKIPGFVKILLRMTNGKRVSDGFFRHTSHHAWPQVPPDKLFLLDEAVMRYPDSMPEMIRSS